MGSRDKPRVEWLRLAPFIFVYPSEARFEEPLKGTEHGQQIGPNIPRRNWGGFGRPVFSPTYEKLTGPLSMPAKQLEMTVNALYVVTMIFCAIAILVAFELIDQRLPAGSSAAH